MNWPDSTNGIPLGDSRIASGFDRPESIDDVRQAVTTRVAEGLAIYPQGGAVSLDYGGTPDTPGIALSTSSINRVIDYPAADMTLTVEAGITIATIQQLLAQEGQRLLIDAPQPARATIGAVFATNTTGPRRFGAGRPRDQILGVSFVTSNGAIVKGGGRVVKNVAGYDFPRLLTGSMGTLGVIVQMTVKVRPIPEASKIVWISFADIDSVTTALDTLNASKTRPMAIELLNAPAARSIGESHGLPIHAYVLVVGYEDNSDSVEWQVEAVRDELNAMESAIVEGPGLWSGLTEFQRDESAPVTIVANLHPSTVARFIEMLDPGLWSAQAHAGNGIIRAHWLAESSLEPVAREIDRLREFAVGDGGNLTLSRCPADWKFRLLVWGQPRADWSLAERIRQTFDPPRLLNPGRFLPSPHADK